MKTFSIALAALMLCAGTAQAATLYAADFGPAVQIDHTTTGNALEASPQSGANFTIGYSGTPASDTTRNFFETTGTSLISSDFGGDHFMVTDVIDVSLWNQISIDILTAFVGTDSFNNAPTEFIEYFFRLDGGAEQDFFSFTDDPNGSDLNANTIVDVTGISSLLVGVNANVNGAGDGWEMSSLTVDGTIARSAGPEVIPLPAGLPLALAGLGALALLRRRKG